MNKMSYQFLKSGFMSSGLDQIRVDLHDRIKVVYFFAFFVEGAHIGDFLGTLDDAVEQLHKEFGPLELELGLVEEGLIIGSLSFVSLAVDALPKHRLDHFDLVSVIDTSLDEVEIILLVNWFFLPIVFNLGTRGSVVSRLAIPASLRSIVPCTRWDADECVRDHRHQCNGCPR